MRAELVLMGRRVDMAPRARRRMLVALIYAALAVLTAVLWRYTHWHGSGIGLFWAIMLACRFFLGGYYTGGLVKPFNGKPPRQSDAAPPLLALKLRVYKPVLAADETAYRNDERELRQRDRAHYAAYQAIGCCLALIWGLAMFRNQSPRLFVWVAMPPDELYCGLAMIAMILFLTLPQAILLWTEPDMEPLDFSAE